MIEMNQEQRQAVRQGKPVRLRESELNIEIIICPAGLYEAMERQLREFLEADEEQAEWVETSMQDLARRLEEDEND